MEGGERGIKRTLLASAKLLNPLLIIVLAIETDADADARVILHAVLAPRLLLAVAPLIVVRCGGGGAVAITGSAAIGFALDDQPTTASGHQLLEHAREFAGDLLEGALDGLVFPLIEHLDELLDAAVRGIQLGAPLGQGVPLRGEVVVLLECLLVDVPVFLERFVDLVQPLDHLVRFCLLVFLQRAVWEDA